MKINKEWHLKHLMPRDPTMEERLTWHIEHAKNCYCRDIPPKLKEEIAKRNVKRNIKKH